MLTLRSFSARNVRTFRELDITFKTGTIVICGANGSGKSTLLNLLKGCLLNDFASSFYGPRSRMVSDFAVKGEPSYAELRADADGTKFVIRRSFPTGNSLIVGKDKPITKDKEIDEELARLGINAELISVAGFLQQNRIAQFMSSTDTERAKAYQILVSADFLEKVWKRLGDYITAKQKIVAAFTDSSAALIEQNVTLAREKTELEEKLEEAKGKKLWSDEDFATARQRLASIDTAQLTKSQSIKSRKALEDAEAALETAKTALEKLSGNVDVDEAELQKQVKTGRASLKAWKAWYGYQKALKAVLEKRTYLRDKLAAWQKMGKTYKDVPVNLPMTQQALGACNALIATCTTKLEAWKKAKVGECDSCGQKITKEQLAKQIAETTKQKESAEKMQTELKAKIASKTAAVSLKTKLDETEKALREELTEWREAKQTLPEKAEKPGTIADLKAIKPAIAEARKSLKTAQSQRTALQTARTNLAKAQATADSAAQARKDAKARYDAVKDLLEEGAKDTLEKQIETQESRRTKLTELEADIKAKVTQIEKNHTSINRTAVERARKVQDEESLAILQLVREKLHREALPKTLAIKAQAFLTEGINEKLQQYGDKFWAEPGENLSFMLNFPDREPKNSAELSIGQQVVLALSFWDTVADFFGLGIQAFDEPTANLDAENIGYLRDMLSVMTDSSRGRRQVFVVTHEPALKSSFQQVIEL